MGKRGKAPLQVFKTASTLLCIVGVACNLLIPLLNGKNFGLNFFNFVEILFYVYAILGEFGYIKTVFEYGEDGKSIIYDTPIPMVQIVAVRIMQTLFYLAFKRSEVIIRSIIILLVIDALFILTLLIDKSSYYYESLEEEQND